MTKKTNKFAQISNIYPQLTEKNRKDQVETALSLLKNQQESEKLLALASILPAAVGTKNKPP